MICVHPGPFFVFFCFPFPFSFPMKVFNISYLLTFIIRILYQEHFPMGLSILYLIDYNIAHFVISGIGIYFQ